MGLSFLLGIPPALIILLYLVSALLHILDWMVTRLAGAEPEVASRPTTVTATVKPLATTSSLQFYARSLAAWASLCLCACYGVLASLVLRAVGFGGLSQWSTGRAFKWAMWWFCGVAFEVLEGEEHLLTRPAVLVGNHQTELDVLMLGHIFPQYCSVTAKSSLRWVPFLGWFMMLSKTVFINRSSNSSRGTIDSAAKTIRSSGQSVFIFPEGTRSYAERPELPEFKKGAFHLAVQAKVPIVPIVVANYSSLLNIAGRNFQKGVIGVAVLPPLNTSSSDDVTALAKTCHDNMHSKLLSLSDHADSVVIGGDRIRLEQKKTS